MNMIIKFSLSGGGWITGDRVYSIYAEVVEAGIPASMVSVLWHNDGMIGSALISLTQISCRFEFVDCDADNLMAIQRAFMHDDFAPDETIKETYKKMMNIRDTVKDEDELAEESND